MSQFLYNRIYLGDSLSGMSNVPDSSVDLVMTSPPYFLKRGTIGVGMIKEMDAYLNSLWEFMRVVIPKVKPTGSIVVNLGDKHREGMLLVPHRFAIGVVDNLGIRMVNEVVWAKKNNSPQPNKRRMVSSFEPIYHFALTKDYKYHYERFTSPSKEPPKFGKGKGLRYYKIIERSSLTLIQKDNALKALEDVMDKLHRGEITDFRMKILGEHTLPFGGFDGGRVKEIQKNGFVIVEFKGGTMLRDVLSVATGDNRNIPHHSIYPLGIPDFFIELLTDEDDIVLDPFAGSGTTLLSAKRKKRNYVGFEINPEFACLAADRIGMDLDKIIEI